MEKKILPVMGMMCAGCSANVERKLKAMDGIKTVAVSLPGRTVMVEYDEKQVAPADMKQVIDSAGYELIIDEDTRVDTLEKNSYRLLLKRMSLSWLFSLLTMSVSMGWIAVGGRDAANQTMLIISLVNMIYCGRGGSDLHQKADPRRYHPRHLLHRLSAPLPLRRPGLHPDRPVGRRL